MDVSEGAVDFQVPATTGPSKTRYQIVGDLSASGACPLVVLHGGPGATHHCVKSNTALARPGRPIIFYDQVGGGQSTHFRDKLNDKSFWTPELFLLELDNLLVKLGVQGRYDLLGHSWGGMLATLHATKQPKGLRRLIIANAPPDFPSWGQAAIGVLPYLSAKAREAIAEGEQRGDRESEAYQAAMGEFSDYCGCRVQPPPDDLIATMHALEDDMTVPLSTCGPSEFLVTGSLEALDITTHLPLITASTLLLSGSFDRYEGDKMVRPFLDNVRQIQWVNFDESSHMPSYEEPEKYLKVVGDFLDTP